MDGEGQFKSTWNPHILGIFFNLTSSLQIQAPLDLGLLSMNVDGGVQQQFVPYLKETSTAVTNCR